MIGSQPTLVGGTVPSRGLYVERLKEYNPTTPGFRHRRIVDHSHLWKGRPVKSLTYGLREKGGRNNTGRTTVWCRGGGHRKLYRLVDFVRAGTAEVVVERLEYDPNRTAWLALVKDSASGAPSYILCPKNVQEGDILRSGDYVDIQVRQFFVFLPILAHFTNTSCAIAARQSPAAQKHPRRHARTQHRDPRRQGRPDRALCGRLRSAAQGARLVIISLL